MLDKIAGVSYLPSQTFTQLIPCLARCLCYAFETPSHTKDKISVAEFLFKTCYLPLPL